MQAQINKGPIKTLFLDIGGVLLTDGWGHKSRDLAVEKFGLDKAIFEERHTASFDTYELDKMSFDEYLDCAVFYEPRDFSKNEFKAFMMEQSKALDGHIDYFKSLKTEFGLKVIAVSNEGLELNEHRIRKFKLDALFDAYISSCYVHLHKPDKDMLKMACNVAHTQPEHGLYIDDRLLLTEVASGFGLQAHQFKDLETAKAFIRTCTFYNASNNSNNASNAI